jgi:hypothetical protein
MQLSKARQRLAVLWFVLSAICFIAFIFIANANVKPEGQGDAWNWFLPNIFPFLTLILAVFVTQTLTSGQEQKLVDKFIFRLAFYVSLFYLLILLGVLISWSPEKLDILPYYKRYNTMLTGLQGLVSISLGIFFTRS